MKNKYYSGIRAIPVLIRFRLILLRYLFQSNKYPLFRLLPRGGGIIKSFKILRKIKFCKFVKFNGKYFFSLNMPGWPSKPFDNMVSKGGLNLTEAGTCYKQVIDSVFLGISRKCNYKCEFCYEKYNLGNSETVTIDRWIKIIQELQKMGVSIFILTGGEPTLRFNGVIKILNSADLSLSDFHMHTSGYGVTSRSAIQLRKAGLMAAGIGLDDYNPERYDKLRGIGGAHKQAVDAVRFFTDAGVFTYVNMCLSKTLSQPEELTRYFEFVEKLGIGIVRWIEPKPCGGYMSNNEQIILNDKEKEKYLDFYYKANYKQKYRNLPPVSYDALFESPDNFGCMMAGLSHFYIDSNGNVNPCVFLPVTFGNINNDDFHEIFQRMRNEFKMPLRITCPSFFLNKAIKSQVNNGVDLPVPFARIKPEFDQLIRTAGKGNINTK